ncbi:MAG: ROK family protein [Actinomycetia bacterium]|nr:ROK family protein [Actinomycetes bacterium]
MTTPAPDPAVLIGIDVGGTRTKSCVVTTEGTVLHEDVRPTPAQVGDGITDYIEGIARELLALAESPVAIGAAVPGFVDDDSGLATWSANLGWRDVPLGPLLSERLGRPVSLSHDVRAGLRAEYAWGAAQGARGALFIPLGTGLAAALLMAGRVITGADWTGELGHVLVEPGGPVCGCGRRGCLEVVSSASAVARAGSAALGRTVSAKEVEDAVRAGDPAAAEVWRHAAHTLAATIAPVLATTGVELLLIGGGLSKAGDLLLQPLREHLGGVLPASAAVTVRAAQLGDRAGALGAAQWAWLQHTG